jgi:hypothetical protein
MPNAAHSRIKRVAKKPKYQPLVGADFNKKFAKFAERKGLPNGPLRNPGFRKKKP